MYGPAFVGPKCFVLSPEACFLVWPLLIIIHSEHHIALFIPSPHKVNWICWPQDAQNTMHQYGSVVKGPARTNRQDTIKK